MINFPVRWRVTVFLAAASVLNYADRAALSAVLAPLRSEFGLSDARLGMLLSLFLWSYALASPFAGILADRRSRSRIVIWSIALWSIFTALTGAANGLVMLCMLSVGLGLSESLFNPAGFALLADHHGTITRGRAMSILSIGSQLGAVAGGACAGFLGERYGWRSGFWVLGVIGIGFALISRFFLVEAPVSASRASSRASAASAIRYLLRVPSYHMLLAKQILAESVTWMFFGWLPLYLLETYHLKLGAAAFIGTTMLQTALVAGIAMGGWISDRMAASGPGRRMLTFGLAYVAAAPFPLIFFGRPALAMVAVAISACSLFRGLGTSNERPTVCEVVPPCFRSTAYGVMNTCATASGAMGVFVAGFMKHYFGLNAVFSAASILFLLTGIALLLGYRFCMPRDMARCLSYEAASEAPA